MKIKVGKMCCRGATFIVLSLFLILFCDTTSSECTQLMPCFCSLPDGSYYNLIALASSEPFTDTKFNLTAYFHPCTNRKIKVNEDNDTTCSNGTGVSLCIYDFRILKNKNETLNFGTVEETKLKLLDSNKYPVFEMQHGGIKSIIKIVCHSDKETYFGIEPPINSKEYEFTLRSPYGCKIIPKSETKGLSTGSVLVILFFTFAGLYFFGGIIILKTLRGATGWEMIPNLDFWSTLPSLVKDGVIFVFGCCRGNTYERI
ncbi:hypothetical protein P5V15_008732 [Pogonomyrmex californicus]